MDEVGGFVIVVVLTGDENVVVVAGVVDDVVDDVVEAVEEAIVVVAVELSVVEGKEPGDEVVETSTEPGVDVTRVPPDISVMTLMKSRSIISQILIKYNMNVIFDLIV